MTRIGWFLIALVGVLLGVGWYFLIFSPTSDEIEAVRAETARVQTEAAEQRARAAGLREIRAAAPEAESRLTFGRTMLPENADMPALFRQLQQASDDAGLRLDTISPSAPAEVTQDGVTVASIDLSMTVQGSYFQLVDLARRIEDPTLTPRALLWQGMSISVGEYPELTATLTGRVFSRNVHDLPAAPDAPPEEEGVEADEADEGDPDGLDELDDLEETDPEDES